MDFKGKWVFVLLLLFFAACAQPQPEPQQRTSLLEGVKCDSTSTLTYENFGKAFFLDWCSGCHSSTLKSGERAGAPTSFDFDALKDVKAHAKAIFRRSGGADATMPPSVQLPDEQKKLLKEWLACGAPSEKKKGE